MIEVRRESTKTITLTTTAPATDVKISIYHEWGDIVRAETSVSAGPATLFSYTLTPIDTESSGIHKIIWTYTMSSMSFTTTVYIKVCNPYTTSSDFFNDYPELESSCFESFDATERKVRSIIDTYCNQEFQYIKNKTLNIDGTGKNLMKLPVRSISLGQIMRDNGDDITTLVESDPASDFWVRHTSQVPSGDPRDYIFDDSPNFFSKRATYAITGDFGWLYVPNNVEEAAKILIADDMNQDSLYRKHSVTFAGIGPVQTRYNPDVYLSIGNVDADVLLMDYNKSLLEYI